MIVIVMMIVMLLLLLMMMMVVVVMKIMMMMMMVMMAMIMRIRMKLTFYDSCIHIYRLAWKQKMTAIQQIVEEKELTVKNNKDMIQGMYSIYAAAAADDNDGYDDDNDDCDDDGDGYDYGYDDDDFGYCCYL